MDDATLVRNTKIRLTRSKTLKDWAMKAVLSNLDAYTKQDGGNELKTKLSPVMREIVLQELQETMRPRNTYTTEEVISLKRSVLALMNTGTEKLFLDSFYDFNEVLLKVSSAAPNVRHLKMDKSDLADCFRIDLNQNAYVRDLSLILKELRILEIVGHSSREVEIALLSKELPNLRVLSSNYIVFDARKMSEEDIRKSFGHLTLLQDLYITWETKYQIWKVLPNLEILKDVKSIGLKLEDFIEDEIFQMRERKCLDFGDYIQDSNVCPFSSSIRHLEITCKEPTWSNFGENLERSTTLESLDLYIKTLLVSVDDILLKFGVNLRWLSITGSIFPSVQLNSLSELCPKLEVLHLSAINVTVNSKQPAKFDHLVELVFKHNCSSDECFNKVLSSAPNLQKLVIDGWVYSHKDLEQVKNLMIENKILLSLRSLQWEIRVSSSERAYKEIATIVKNAAAVLPDFRTLKFSYDGSIFSSKSFAESTPSRYFCSLSWNISLYKAVVNDTNLIEILKSFE